MLQPEKSPPMDRDLELQLVSQAMQSREAFSDAAEILPSEERFHDHACRTIWRAMRDLHGQGKPWDLQLLSAHLHQTGQLADAGGYAGMSDTYTLAPTTANATHYAERIHDLWLLRSLAMAGQSMHRDAMERAGTTPAELRAKYERELFTLGESGSVGKPITSKELASLTADRLQRIVDGEKVGFPFGFVDIDRIFTGLAPKTVTLLAGRPGGGKTKLAVNVVAHLATLGIPTAFYSLEMANEELGLRLACALSSVDSTIVTQNRMDDDQWRAVNAACDSIARMPTYWQDKPGLKPAELIASLRRMKRQHGVEVAVVDHILLMRPDERQNGRSRNDEVGDISRMVKLAAKEVGVAILALCQMNRGIEGRNDAPRLSDLRDSGNLEQDADNVLFLHKPKDDGMGPGDVVDIYIAKQRNGPTGKCSLYDRKGVFRFENFGYQP